MGGGEVAGAEEKVQVMAEVGSCLVCAHFAREAD